MIVSHRNLTKVDDPPTKLQTDSSQPSYCKSRPQELIRRVIQKLHHYFSFETLLRLPTPARVNPPSPSSPRPLSGTSTLSFSPKRSSSHCLSCISGSPLPSTPPPPYSSPSPKIIKLQLPRRVTWFPFTEIHMQMSQIPHASRFVSTILDASKL